MDYYDFLDNLVRIIGLIGVVVPSIAITLNYQFKKKKMLEEHKTNNLALAYQILSQRPEITLDNVKELMELAGTEQPKLEDKH